MDVHSILYLIATILFGVGIFAYPAPASPAPFYTRFSFISAGLFCCSLAWFLISLHR